MRLSSVALPKGRWFCSRKNALKGVFSDLEPLSIHMGSLGAKFAFDSRCPQRPVLTGPVVASLSVSRELTGILSLYGISASEYGTDARAHFEDRVLPRMRQWLIDQIGKPETAVLGVEQLIIEWTGQEHREHSLRYL